MSFFKHLQSAVNSVVGNSYRDIFITAYPGPNYQCKGCGKGIDRTQRNGLHVDHIIPQKCGGTNAITNLQPLCAACNCAKGAKINTLSLQYSGKALLRELKRALNY